MAISKKKEVVSNTLVDDITNLMAGISPHQLTELQIKQRGDAIEQMIYHSGWKEWLEPFIRRCIAGTAANLIVSPQTYSSMEKVLPMQSQALAYQEIFNYVNEAIRIRNEAQAKDKMKEKTEKKK